MLLAIHVTLTLLVLVQCLHIVLWVFSDPRPLSERTITAAGSLIAVFIISVAALVSVNESYQTAMTITQKTAEIGLHMGEAVKELELQQRLSKEREARWRQSRGLE